MCECMCVIKLLPVSVAYWLVDRVWLPFKLKQFRLEQIVADVMYDGEEVISRTCTTINWYCIIPEELITLNPALQMGQGRKEAVRAVFYRALQLCPWAKVSPVTSVTFSQVNFSVTL